MTEDESKRYRLQRFHPLRSGRRERCRSHPALQGLQAAKGSGKGGGFPPEAPGATSHLTQAQAAEAEEDTAVSAFLCVRLCWFSR